MNFIHYSNEPGVHVLDAFSFQYSEEFILSVEIINLSLLDLSSSFFCTLQSVLDFLSALIDEDFVILIWANATNENLLGLGIILNG